MIPEFYESIEEYGGRKHLIIAPIEINNEVLANHKNFWNERLKKINKINSSKYIFKEDYHKMKVSSVKFEDEVQINLPVNKLIKFNAVTISNRLIIEKDNKLFLETYLEECLYDDSWFKN